MWIQKEIKLKPKSKGFHLITNQITGALPELASINIGILHILLKHTSASLSINENADPTVRQDFESFFNRTVKENENYYLHTLEGSDDLPAHIKASLLGVTISLPVSNGQLCLGTWQGIYLGEHRNQGGPRSCVLTLQGDAVSTKN